MSDSGREVKESDEKQAFAELSPDDETIEVGNQTRESDHETKGIYMSNKHHETKKAYKNEKDTTNKFMREDQVRHHEAKRISYVTHSNTYQTPALGILAIQCDHSAKLKAAPTPEPENITDEMHVPCPSFTSARMEQMRGAPGAVAVHGDDANEDDGTIGWGSIGDDATREGERPVSVETLITATLVQDEPPLPSGPIVTATRLRMSLLHDRRVQAAIIIIIVSAVGLIAWAFARPKVVVTPDTGMLVPSEQPSSSPTFSPGTLIGRFCSQDPFNGYGGDFCPEGLPCQPCPSPNERLSVCLGEGTPIQVLEIYCANALSTRSRPCGDYFPECQLQNYCVPCESYTPLGELVRQVCYSPDLSLDRRSMEDGRDLQDMVESNGYALCELLNDDVSGTLPPALQPTPSPTAQGTAVGTFLSPPNPPPQGSFSPTPGGTDFDLPAPPTPQGTLFPTTTSDGATLTPSASSGVAAEVEGLLSLVSLDSGKALNTQGSPQNNAFQELLRDPLLSDYADVDIIQRYALIVFYYSTNGDEWVSSFGWFDSGEVCDWEFIECNTESAVTSIVTRSNNITGQLPPELYLLESLGKKLAVPFQFHKTFLNTATIVSLPQFS